MRGLDTEPLSIFTDSRKSEGRTMIWVTIRDWERVPPESGEDERDRFNADVGIRLTNIMNRTGIVEMTPRSRILAFLYSTEGCRC